MVDKYQLFIDGKWRDSSNGATMPAVNPFNQEVWASVPVATEADVEAAIAAARRAYETTWRHAAGLDELEPLAIDHFDSGALMLEAAAQGLGIAFMHASHFDEAHDSRLVKLFDVQVDSPYSYWFVCRHRAMQQKPVKIFHDWLVETLT